MNEKEQKSTKKEIRTSAEIPESEKSEFLKKLEREKGGTVVFDTHSYPDDVVVVDRDD